MEQMLAHCKSTPCLNLLSSPRTLLSCKIKKETLQSFTVQATRRHNFNLGYPEQRLHSVARTHCGCLLRGQMCCELCFDFTCAHQSRLPLSAAGSQSMALLGAPQPSAALPFTPRWLTQHFMKCLAAATRRVDGQFIL